MKRPCFTLVELLVAIGSIAFLVAILIPALRSSRQGAKAVLCSSNIKQLILGLVMYETENQTFPYGFRNTLTPPRGGYPGDFAYDRMGWWWFNYIVDYSRKDSGKDSIIWCPSREIRSRGLRDNVLCGNYGVNRSVCKSSDDIQSRGKEFVGTPLSSSDIPHPSQTLLIVDSGYSMITWWHVTDVPPIAFGSTIEDAAYVPGLEINKDKNLWPGQEWDAVNGRHPNKSINVGFVDGHVARKKTDELFVEKIAEDYKNKSPLWLPK